jgi:hypothetical protein
MMMQRIPCTVARLIVFPGQASLALADVTRRPRSLTVLIRNSSSVTFPPTRTIEAIVDGVVVNVPIRPGCVTITGHAHCPIRGPVVAHWWVIGGLYLCPK